MINTKTNSLLNLISNCGLFKKDSPQTVEKIFSVVQNDSNLKEKYDTIGKIYTFLMLSDKFIYIGNNKWNLKNLYTPSELQNLIKNNYFVVTQNDKELDE